MRKSSQESGQMSQFEEQDEFEVQPQLDDLAEFQNTDLSIISTKIHEILQILANFKELREEGRSRHSYIEEIRTHFCAYYGYNPELIDLFLKQFAPQELMQFLESQEQQRPLTIRTNQLKTRRKELAQTLIQRGVNLDPLAEWSKVGLVIYESKVPIGATPEYLAGHYMLQSASSFLPVIALAPQKNEKILDMSAAPGGKTTYIAQLMNNTGRIVANDIKPERLPALKYNILRLGITNCIVTNYDGRKMPKNMTNFDRVLLDAPCSGTGIISRDPSIKLQRTLKDIYKASHLQKELILSAIDCLAVGGVLVYSTCSIMVLENEAVVDYALKNRFVKVVPCEIDLGEAGVVNFDDKRFDQSIKMTRKVFPHVHNMDGFYFAKLVKIQNGPRKMTDAQKADLQKKQEAKGKGQKVSQENKSLDKKTDKKTDKKKDKKKSLDKSLDKKSLKKTQDKKKKKSQEKSKSKVDTQENTAKQQESESKQTNKKHKSTSKSPKDVPRKKSSLKKQTPSSEEPKKVKKVKQ